jgi:hypothetical protein
MTKADTRSFQPQTSPVPSRYRGVWRRSLLKAGEVHDVDSLVYWMQTSRWHADIRIPASRPDFTHVRSLHDCDRAQLCWLASQQGFAGVTEVDAASGTEICRWHRVVDFQPPAATPDAGAMQFERDRLVETGVHADYLEHWQRVPHTDAGFAVLQQRATAESSSNGKMRLLLIAGRQVMHVRSRSYAWPGDVLPSGNMRALDDQTLRAMLDFEISFGVRTAKGWQITHSTLPWLEGRGIEVLLVPPRSKLVELAWSSDWSQWEVLEWEPPQPSC